LREKPTERTTDRFGVVSIGAGVLGLLSLSTPVGWLGLLGAGAAILYDATEGYKSREEEDRGLSVLLLHQMLFYIFPPLIFG
jgi:hypothetical protein